MPRRRHAARPARKYPPAVAFRCRRRSQIRQIFAFECTFWARVRKSRCPADYGQNCIFRYGKEEKTVDVSPQLIERYLPINFLQDFNIVDTPGTNTMVNEHQRITEQFVPRADLVLFVFSVINPWTQSAWDFLGFVQQRWLKNTIFVLQQADLRDPA